MTLIESRRNLRDVIQETPQGDQENPLREPQQLELDNLASPGASSAHFECMIQEELVCKDVEILHKKISRMKGLLEQRKTLNKKMLASLRKKKGQMAGLVDEVNLVYSRVDRLSVEFEQGMQESSKLRTDIESGEKRLIVMRHMLSESYKETKTLREDIQKKEDALKKLTDKLTDLEEERNELKYNVEDAKEESSKLMKCLELKDAEKKAARIELGVEIKKQERAKKRVKREKDEVCWNVETLKILLNQGKAECEKLKGQLDLKMSRVQQLEGDFESSKKDTAEAKAMYRKVREENRSQCSIF